MLFMSTLDLLYLKYFRMNNPLPTAFDLINAILVADLLYKLRSVDDHEAYIATTESDSTHMAYQDHVISMTLGTPTVDEDTIAAIKTTLSLLPKGDSDALECNASSDADTTGDRSSIMQMDVLRLGAWEEEFGSEPLGEGDITDDVQWGGPLRPISSSRSETQSHCSGFTENFSHV
ncbi:hypothetical protein QCA50_006574 [Cerrena zonata]|uniref:Uncharacterized protein n=1 Tax=Cerrena zonata TaxID=2478898 RepID=A0AAW0GJL1_9APHY